MNELLMNDALMLLLLLAVIGLGVGAYLFWSRFRSGHAKDKSSGASSIITGEVLAKIALAPRKPPK